MPIIYAGDGPWVMGNVCARTCEFIEQYAEQEGRRKDEDNINSCHEDVRFRKAQPIPRGSEVPTCIVYTWRLEERKEERGRGQRNGIHD